jgi:hypothetical protein
MIHVNKEAVLAAFDASGDIETVVKAFEVPRGVPRAMLEEICGVKKVVTAAPVVKKAPVVKAAEKTTKK